MRQFLALVLVLTVSGRLAAQDADPKDARIKDLEAQLAAEQAKAAASAPPTLSDDEQRARTVKAYKQVYDGAKSSPAAEACALSGRAFFVLVIDGKAAPLCQVQPTKAAKAR